MAKRDSRMLLLSLMTDQSPFRGVSFAQEIFYQLQKTGLTFPHSVCLRTVLKNACKSEAWDYLVCVSYRQPMSLEIQPCCPSEVQKLFLFSLHIASVCGYRSSNEFQHAVISGDAGKQRFPCTVFPTPSKRQVCADDGRTFRQHSGVDDIVKRSVDIREKGNSIPRSSE